MWCGKMKEKDLYEADAGYIVFVLVPISAFAYMYM